MKTLVLLTVLTAATATSAQFTSGFESWNDTIPTDWVGLKTNINLDSIAKVTSNPHGGSFAIRFINQTNNNKRFTTLQQHTDSGSVYNYIFWARGAGDVHVSMWDGRPLGGGYATYSNYVPVAGNSWQQVIASVLCKHTSDSTEFIIGCRNTSGPDHLVVDDVNITPGGAPQPRSIHDIQLTADPGGISPENGHIVITGGIVTGIDTIGPNGYFIQNSVGPWSGIYVFDNTHPVTMGDSVTFQASVSEYHNATELGSVSDFAVVGNYPVPPPQPLSANALQDEQWEGVLVRLSQATCTIADSVWTVNDVSANQLIGDLMYLYAPAIGSVYNITGCMLQYDGDHLLHPRFPEDIEVVNGIAEEGALHGTTVAPNPASDAMRIYTGLSTRVYAALTDMLGRTVRSFSITANATLDVAGLSNGLYHLTLREGNSVKSIAVQVR